MTRAIHGARPFGAHLSVRPKQLSLLFCGQGRFKILTKSAHLLRVNSAFLLKF